jgi:hypothetical protein
MESVLGTKEVAMRRVAIVLVWLAVPLVSSAHEGHKKGKTKAVPAAHDGQITGEVIDITCFMDHDSSGAEHASCASKCIAKGNPVGILAGDTLYVAIMSNHEAPNAKLAPFAGKRVTVKGETSEKNGIHVIDVESIEPAAPSTSETKTRDP